MKLSVLYTIILLVAGLNLSAQVLPVGTPLLEDYYRREQLLGKLDPDISFSVRPLTAAALQRKHLFFPDSNTTTPVPLWQSADGQGSVQLLPVVWQQQVNSTYPMGFNDGAMIPARGYQLLAGGGFFARYKFLSVQLMPEVVLAQNGVYEGFGGERGPDQHWYRRIGNEIDMPERFGTGWYTRIFPGQSSVRLTFDPVSVGLSTENLWWGPGIQNSILMSNTAPGFAHLNLNTTRPVKTPIGAFEGQVVGGRLEASGFPPSLLGNSDHQEQYYRPKPDDWRYFSGVILSYQPKWLSGLSLGLIRTFTVYRGDMGSSLGDYLPFFAPALKEKAAGESGEEDVPRDQQAGIFFRWAVPKANAEVYAEYVRNDHSYNFRDLIAQFDQTRGYTVGLRKLVPISLPMGGHLQVQAEVTQLAVSNTRYYRSAGAWYVHSQVRDGYTNEGQLLGAGIGPGSNMQTVSLSWINGLKQLGLQADRLSHNEDFKLTHPGLEDLRKNWVDASMMAYASWDYKQFLASASIRFTHAYNYQYSFYQPSGAYYWDFEPQDKNNLQVRLGLAYRF